MSGETREEISPWTIDSLHEHLGIVLLGLAAESERRTAEADRHMHDLVTLLDERYAAQKDAVAAALAAAEKAVEAALVAAEKAVEVRLDSQKEAIVKADLASEKRFESVNEFRQTLTDQAALFMPRTESDSRREAGDEKLGALIARLEATGAMRDERIITLEKFQATWSNIDSRLHALNQLRAEVLEDRAAYVRKESHDTSLALLAERISEIKTEALTSRGEYVRNPVLDATVERLSSGSAVREARLAAIEKWQSKAAGAVAVLVIFSGLIGGFIVKALS